ncbi:ABC transporter permease [Sphingobium cloacae]|uniref:Uncharacterized protein n=1 Tax=Sphingobium cloacae TaxID=120107 RepID=A0A1E1F4Z2_9SPHN|nr:ABC transporter permease [Sphingobium cloacae]BAV65588.1 hypothetical protein SCLO_1025480 [Sphingobium cloacae]
MKTNLRIAIASLRQNRMQALLTLLGMSVGVAMVVVVSGLGRGAQLRIEDQIESAGPTRIILRSGNFRPAAMEMTGQQDSGGGEPSEGSVSPNPLASDPPAEKGAIAPATDAAVADARRRAIETTSAKTHRTPPAPLDDAHVALLRRSIRGVRAVAASMRGNIPVDPASGIAMRTLRIEGIEAALPEMRGWTLVMGRFPGEDEYRAGAPVMVATADVVRRLWPDEAKPLGRSLSLKGRAVKLIGIIAVKHADEPSVAVPLVHVPLLLAKALLDRTDYDSIMVQTASVGVTTAVAASMRKELRALHTLPADTLDDFRIETQSVSAMPGMGSDPRLMRAVHSNVVEFEQASWEEMAKSLRQANRTFTLLLAAAAAVSLLVGGIGVMNIMLVSVTARTREIGLRMAVGARERDVMTQFLVEAVLLAAIGGAGGLLLGGIGLAVAHYGLHWATALSPAMLLLALAMAAGTGVVFGYGPARRASILDPVVAVRSE